MYVQITQINPVGSDVICDVLHILYLFKRDLWGFLGILLLLFTLEWGPSIRSWTSPDSSIQFLDVPITVNKCLLDIACNQLISIHLNVEFIEVPVPLAPLSVPLQRPLQMGLINSLSIHPSIALDHSSAGQQHPDRRTDNRTGVESTAIQGVCLPLDMGFAIF